MATSGWTDPPRFHRKETRKENVLKAHQREWSLGKQRHVEECVCLHREVWCVLILVCGGGAGGEGGKGVPVRMEG